jgi:hypothetical protein
MRRTLYLGVDDWLRPPTAMAERALRRGYMMGLRDFQDVWLYRCALPAHPRWVLGMNVDAGPLSHRSLAAAFQGGSEARTLPGAFRLLPESALDAAALEPVRRVSTAGLALRAWVHHSFGISLPA